MISHRVLFPLLGSMVLLSACKKPVVESYRVPKEAAAPAPVAAAADPHAGSTNAPPMASPPSAGAASPMANTPVTTASGAALTWTAPADWKPKATSSMRKGSYTISGDGGEADLSITAFPGDVGGELANLNRWRGQLSLPPVAQSDLATAAQHLSKNGLQLTVVDLASTGANAQRILGAMVPYSGATWFFKLSGPDALVAKEKTAFMAFLDTIKPAADAK